MEKMEAMEEVTREKYDAVVTEVLSKYKAMNHIKPLEVQKLTKELKGHWNVISKALAVEAKRSPKKAK